MFVEISKYNIEIEIDEIDYNYVMYHNWNKNDKNYFQRFENGKSIYLHKEIARRAGISRQNQIDHIDRNKLNNKRDNLRSATKYQNAQNYDARSHGKSRFKGVNESYKSWRVTIAVNNKKIYISKFKSEYEAAYGYNIAAEFLHKEFAVFNILPEIYMPDKEIQKALRRKIIIAIKTKLLGAL